MSKKLHGFLREAQIICVIFEQSVFVICVICVICGQTDKQDIRNALTLTNDNFFVEAWRLLKKSV
jgi:hypothetical protein